MLRTGTSLGRVTSFAGVRGWLELASAADLNSVRRDGKLWAYIQLAEGLGGIERQIANIRAQAPAPNLLKTIETCLGLIDEFEGAVADLAYRFECEVRYVRHWLKIRKIEHRAATPDLWAADMAKEVEQERRELQDVVTDELLIKYATLEAWLRVSAGEPKKAHKVWKDIESVFTEAAERGGREGTPRDPRLILLFCLNELQRATLREGPLSELAPLAARFIPLAGDVAAAFEESPTGVDQKRLTGTVIDFVYRQVEGLRQQGRKRAAVKFFFSGPIKNRVKKRVATDPRSIKLHALTGRLACDIGDLELAKSRAVWLDENPGDDDPRTKAQAMGEAAALRTLIQKSSNRPTEQR
jgi:hypothetical protein